VKATKRLKSKKNPSTTNEGDQGVQKKNYNQNKSNHYIQTLSLSTTSEATRRLKKKLQNKSLYTTILSLSTANKGDQEAQKRKSMKINQNKSLYTKL